jgi:hypothetical protein
MSTTGPLHPGQLTRGETLDKFCVGPIPDLVRSGRRPLSALATIVSKRRELTVAQSRYCGSRPHSALLGLSQQILRHKNLVVVATVLL